MNRRNFNAVPANMASLCTGVFSNDVAQATGYPNTGYNSAASPATQVPACYKLWVFTATPESPACSGERDTEACSSPRPHSFFIPLFSRLGYSYRLLHSDPRGRGQRELHPRDLTLGVELSRGMKLSTALSPVQICPSHGSSRYRVSDDQRTASPMAHSE